MNISLAVPQSQRFEQGIARRTNAQLIQLGRLTATARAAALGMQLINHDITEIYLALLAVVESKLIQAQPLTVTQQQQLTYCLAVLATELDELEEARGQELIRLCGQANERRSIP